MGLGLSPFVVAGARDQMRADEQMDWQREDQQFRRGQREREVKRAAVADELMADQMTDYRDERAFTSGLRDTTRQNAGASRFDFTTALENFARSNGRVELADKFRADRENGHLDVMKRVVTAASSGADATRIAGILNEGRPAAERIDPAALQLQTDASGRTTGLVMRGPQGRPVPIDLNQWGLMTGLVKPTSIDIKDRAMVIQNGDGSQSLVTIENGALVFKKNPNHVPDAPRAGGRGSGGDGGAGGGGAGAQAGFEKNIDDFIRDIPGMAERDPVSGSVRGLTPRGLEVRERAAGLMAGARQGALTNGRAGEPRPAPFDSPLAAIRIANDPSGKWKDVEVSINGRPQRATAWVINDAASGGEVAYFPNRPIYRDLGDGEVVMRTLRQSQGFPKLLDEVRRLAGTPNAEQLIDQELQMPGAGRVLLSYVRDAQAPQDQQTMPVGENGMGMQGAPAGPAATAGATPSFGQQGGVTAGLSRAAGAVAGVFRGEPPPPDQTDPSVRGVVGAIGEPGAPMDLGMGPTINPRFTGGPQGTPRVGRSGRFDPEGAGYDDATAGSAGMARDEAGHMGSVAEVPEATRRKLGLPQGSYLMLKGRKHETWDKAVEAEEARGSRVVKVAGRYYSVPRGTQTARGIPQQ
jgi:hypothetical protein